MKLEHNISKAQLIETTIMAGREPKNPIGSCFDTVAWQARHGENRPDNLLICHGLGVANLPGQQGHTMAHAWLEWGNTAFDTTWGVSMNRFKYRKEIQLKYLVQYTYDEFMCLWLEHNYPGPWDKKIKSVADNKGEKL